MGEWSEPNGFSAVFRLTSSKYADAFVDKGSIKFNTPQSWIDYAKKYGDGRGDGLEGTLAFCDSLDVERISELTQKYESSCILNPNTRPLLKETSGRRLFMKDKRSLELPCFCVYIMKNSLFPSPDSEGKHRVSGVIPASYFRDFSDNSLPEDIEKLPLEDQPALIIIKDFKEFRNRLYKALRQLGLEDDEIIIGNVSYIDFETHGPYGWMDFGLQYPKELLVKNIRFAEQSEARVIIKTNKKEVIERLSVAPIELGSMKDITQVYKGYLHEGMRVQMTVDVYEE
ncbi:hypothetical protein BK126_26280 [Paenibacillus sp. FSL H7-0326]|uniref:hypothetical protein n=1 Tax=Paenibacillus sp. FSL H7-0326 TaxID=1921144 RepID=UPI00096E534F|nr:hypothetical protein [Paenibacillus sp. FSL H7-0326]OMC63703.1 hypothetical protein BK126_26280 [Paenibacillus sp. FSL H7-0326]